MKINTISTNHHLESVCVMVSQLMHLLHLLLAFLETPEVVLDEESCIELADGDVIISCGNDKPPNDKGETDQQYTRIEHAKAVKWKRN